MSINHKLDKRLTNLKQSSKNSSLSVNTEDNLDLKIRVLIVDDLKLMIEGLTALFSNEEDIEVVGFADNGKEAIEKVKELKPDVVVMDLIMPVMDGIEATKVISKQLPDVKILILSSFEDDASVSESLLAGAHGYALKSTVSKKLALAIRTVHNGSHHFAPGILDSLAKAASKNVDSSNLTKVDQKACIIDSENSQLAPETKAIKDKATASSEVKAIKAKVPVNNDADANKPTPAKTLTTKKVNSPKAKKTKKPKSEKPLFPYGDWVVILSGVFILSRTDGMGHHLGHAGLFLLMLALLARPIKGWWSQPLKYRRAIGIFSFAAAEAHAIYATSHVLDGDLSNIFNLSSMHLLGMFAGLIALALMAPAAATSFQSMQRKLGKNWRQIHLLTVPSLAIAVFHTVLIGPHYLANLHLDMIYHVRTYAVIVAGIFVLLIRNRVLKPALKSEAKTGQLSEV